MSALGMFRDSCAARIGVSVLAVLAVFVTVVSVFDIVVVVGGDGIGVHTGDAGFEHAGSLGRGNGAPTTWYGR